LALLSQLAEYFKDHELYPEEEAPQLEKVPLDQAILIGARKITNQSHLFENVPHTVQRQLHFPLATIRIPVPLNQIKPRPIILARCRRLSGGHPCQGAWGAASAPTSIE